MDAVRSMQNQVTNLVTEHPYLTLAGVSATSLVIWFSAKRLRSKPRATHPPDTLVVYGTDVGPDVPNLSPFILKLETYLKLAKIPYVLSGDIVFSSKGKVPWIIYNGTEVADSQFCIEFVKKQFRVDLNEGLTTEQKAVAHAFRVMMDEFHFWCYVFFRFYDIDDAPLKRFIPPRLVRLFFKRKVGGSLRAQGVGRHTEEEILDLFTNNLKAVHDFLGDKPFMMGDHPTEVDSSVFSLLAEIYFYPPSQLNKLLGDNFLLNLFPKLHDYVLRVKQLTYPDLK